MKQVLEYVCGFMMDDEWALLLRKARPDWQQGKLNGVGGKLEDQDRTALTNSTFSNGIHNAMVREFKEETGGSTLPQDWVHYHTEHWEHDDREVYVYFLYCRELPRRMHDIQDRPRETDEPLEVVWWYTADFLMCNQHDNDPKGIMYNLPYLLLMARAEQACRDRGVPGALTPKVAP